MFSSFVCISHKSSYQFTHVTGQYLTLIIQECGILNPWYYGAWALYFNSEVMVLVLKRKNRTLCKLDQVTYVMSVVQCTDNRG
jgi:hypothetical protein